MGSPQLYYTSCEHGLSGYTGYQFNAATPGVDARVLREVERFTVYEPPRSLPPEQFQRHPVNLCYSPDLGGVRVLSRVVSSGDDPSGRPGNYFAHTLLLNGATDPLPAELWGASFWTGRPVTEPNLPGLIPTPGPLDRERTTAWLRGRDEATLSRLLIAVDAAIDDGPPVLLMAQDEEAAHWVAALSHLLPPRRALGMSFATYSGSPENTLVNVVAVPVGTDTRMLRGRFVIFDAPSLARTHSNGGFGAGTGPARTGMNGAGRDGAGPDENASNTRAVVSTLLRTGVRDAPELWAGAAPYACGQEGALARWRPLLAAASLADDSVPTTESDLRAVRGWLPEAAPRLPSDLTRDLLDRLLDLDPGSLHDDELARLQRVVHTYGSWALTERLEGLLARRALNRIITGSPAPLVAPMRSSRVSASAGERVGALLAGGLGRFPEPDRALELLRWARAGEVPLPESNLERYGVELVARRLAEHPPRIRPAPHLAELVTDHTPVRRGAARGLGELSDPNLTTLATGPIGALFMADRDASTAVLRELRMLHAHEGDPLPLLREVVSLRARARPHGPPGLSGHDLDRELLLRVWGTVPEAEAVVASFGVVDENTRLAPDVGVWCTEVLSRLPSREQERWWYEAVSLLWRRNLPLPPEGRSLLRDWHRVEARVGALDRARGVERPRALAELTAHNRGCGPVVGRLVLRRVGDRLLRWDQNLSARVLAECGPEVFDAYRRVASERLTLACASVSGRAGRPLDVALVVRVFLTARRMAGTAKARGPVSERGRELLTNVLEPASLTWSRRNTSAARKAFTDPEEERAFEQWVRQSREQSGRRGLFARLWKGPR